MGAGSSTSKKAKAAAAAQKGLEPGQHPSGSQVFDSIDLDKSGKLSLPELQTALHDSFGFGAEEIITVFTILDRDGDGEVDRAEFIAGFDKYEALSTGGAHARELLKIWAAGTPDHLKDKRSEVVCGAASQCCGCPMDTGAVGLLQDEPPRLVFVGCTGCGKSSLCTAITGQDSTKDAREGSSFKIGDGAKSETQVCSMGEHQWLGTQAQQDRAVIIDTPGLNDSEGKDEQHIVTIIEAMRKVEYVTAIVLVVNSADPRFSKSLQDVVSRFEKTFCGDDAAADRDARLKSFYQNIVVCFQRWKMNEDAVADREESGITEERRTSEFNAQFHEKFPHCRLGLRSIPCVFVDSHDRNLKRKQERLAALKHVLPEGTFRTADLSQLVPRISHYDATGQNFVRGHPIIQLKPNLIEERVTVVKWHVSPALPPGLSIDSRGVISGTPSTAAPAVIISVVAESSGGKSKAFTLPPIEIQLNEQDIERELSAQSSKFDPCPQSFKAPQNEDDMSLILKSITDAANVCLSQGKAALQQKFAGMLQLPKLLDIFESNLTAAKLSVETDVRDKHQRLVKESLEIELAMQKADHEVQMQLRSCTEDYALFKRSVKHLERFQPPAGSQAALTLERGLKWLSDIERISCSIPGCPCICPRKDLSAHQELCLFSLPLLPHSAVQIVDGVSCGVGFDLSVVDASNSDLAQYAGHFQLGPCRNIGDDQPDWFHFIDRNRRRIIRIKREKSTSAFQAQPGSNPWLLCVWDQPGQEKVVLHGEDSSSVDDAKFAGFKMTPAKVIKGLSENVPKVSLKKDSVKLMYFGGEWCPHCPPFTKKLKIFFEIVREAIGSDAVQVIFCSSDRSADAMLSYFGLHHGDWYALPYNERELDGRLSEKYNVQGIPTLHALRNNGEMLEDDEIDIGDEIRKIPDNAASAKPAALALFKRLQEAYATAPAGFIPEVEYETIIKCMQAVVPPDSGHDARIICNPKDLQTGRFGAAARGLLLYLKVGPQWKESSLSIAGVQEEVARLADCPDCAEVHASVFDALLQLPKQAEVTRRLAGALKQLKALRESAETDAPDLAISAGLLVKSIREELGIMECWYYGCSSKVPMQWPTASVQLNAGAYTRTFNQPLCERCMRYRLDHTSIQADLNYIISEAASEATFWNGVRDKGRAGKTLDSFMKSKEVHECALSIAEVASLRLYTSHSFEAVNIPLRDPKRTTSHPLPAIVSLIQSGLKKLRALGCDDKRSKETVVLWRGSSNMVMPEEFEAEGGTELAPMSTTTDLTVALNYALKGAGAPALLFRIVTENSLTRGCDLQWLSLFPGEAETLFPPLTYIQPTGRQQLVEHNGCQVTVAEVRTTLA